MNLDKTTKGNIMKNSEKYPDHFKEFRNGETHQIHLIAGSVELSFDDIPLSFNELTRIIKELNRTSVFKSNGWNRNPENDRISADMFRLPAVQKLFDYARTATHAIKWMKEQSIENGAARYNPETGKFEFNKKEESMEAKEEIQTEPIVREKFAWGSSQYDTLAHMFRLASQYTFDDVVSRLEGTGYTVDCVVNSEMLNVVKDGILGEMFTAWKNSSKDLWYALSMAEDIVFTHGITVIDEDGNELDNDTPLVQSLTATLAVEYGCITEEQFKGFDT